MSQSTEIYEYEYLIIHGPKKQADAQGYPDAVGWDFTSHDGNPAFCMHLKVSDFTRNSDSSVGFTVYEAELRSMIPSSKFFGYPFEVFAAILIGDVAAYRDYQDMLDHVEPYSKVTLFSKDAQPSQWEDKVIRLQSPTVLTAPNPDNLRTYLIISILSVCSCGQSGIDTVVYADDLTDYIPPPQGGYLWRKFGSSASEDPVGNSINPAKLDGQWHLVRPLYMADNVNGVKSWIDVDEGVPL